MAAFDDVRTSMEYQSSDGEGAVLAALGHLLVPGNKDALLHLMGMCSLSPEAARGVALIFASEFQGVTVPTAKKRRELNLHSLSEAARIAAVYMLLSNSENARGRNDLTAVLAGTVRRTASKARNFLSRGRGSPQGQEL